MPTPVHILSLVKIIPLISASISLTINIQTNIEVYPSRESAREEEGERETESEWGGAIKTAFNLWLKSPVSECSNDLVKHHCGSELCLFPQL